MAVTVAPAYLQALLTAGTVPDLDAGGTDVRAIALDDTYTYSDAHEFLDDVDSEAIIGASGALSNKSVTGGAFDADNPTITGAPEQSGRTIVAVWFYVHTGTDSTSRLLCFVDEDSSSDPLSQLCNGGDINLNLNAGGIFDLANPA